MFTEVGLSHAEDVADRATRGLADDHDAPLQAAAVADDAALAIVLARVVDLDGDAGKDKGRVFEIESAIGQRLVALGRGLVYLQKHMPQS